MRERKKKKEEKKKHGKINQSISINQSIKPTNQSNQSSINKQCGINFSASVALVPLLGKSGHTRIELNQTTESADRPAIDRLAGRFAREYKQHYVQKKKKKPLPLPLPRTAAPQSASPCARPG
jgi:hypothetical protein